MTVIDDCLASLSLSRSIDRRYIYTVCTVRSTGVSIVINGECMRTTMHGLISGAYGRQYVDNIILSRVVSLSKLELAS
jgi:hypothetical protein